MFPSERQYFWEAVDLVVGTEDLEMKSHFMNRHMTQERFPQREPEALLPSRASMLVPFLSQKALLAKD